MAVLEEQLTAIERCNTIAVLRRTIQKYMEDYGFSAFVIVDLSDPWNEIPPHLTTYDQKWLNIYAAEKLLAVDPALTFAKRTNFPFNWAGLTLSKQPET